MQIRIVLHFQLIIHELFHFVPELLLHFPLLLPKDRLALRNSDGHALVHGVHVVAELCLQFSQHLPREGHVKSIKAIWKIRSYI